MQCGFAFPERREAEFEALRVDKVSAYDINLAH